MRERINADTRPADLVADAFTPGYRIDWQYGYADAIADKPRALGGTRPGYRAGYDAGLSDRLKDTR